MATGGVLEIDAKFLKQLKDADNALNKISETSRKMQTNIIGWMQSINKDGVMPFYEKLQQLEQQYRSTSSTFEDVKGFKRFAQQAKRAADRINGLISAIEKTPEFNLEVNLRAKQSSKQYQEEYKKEYREREALFDKAIKEEEERKRKERKLAEEVARYEIEQEQKVFNRRRQAEADMRAIEQRNHKQRQREYEEMFRELDKQAQKESQMRAANYARIQRSGDTSKQAIAGYNRLYSDKGVQSLNNMNKVLHQLQDAQNKLNLRTEEGKRKYDELQKKIKKIQEDINKATQANDKFKKSQSRLLNTTDQLQRKLALLFSVSAIQGYLSKLVEVRKELERQQKALAIIIQNKDEADKLWNQTIQLALKSPFQVKELITYTEQLAAYRIETDKLHDTTKRLADVSAGLGVDMQRLILAYGQIRAAKYLRGTELRQLTEAGIPMLEELATYLSEMEQRAISAGDVFEMISKRLVTFEDVEAVFRRMTDEGGVFYEMQEKQSNTLYGKISNLHDAIDLMLNDIGKSNDGLMKGGVDFARKLVDNWKEVSIALKAVALYLTASKVAMFLYARGTKVANDQTLWFNKSIKANIASIMMHIRGLTLATVKTKGLAFAQKAWAAVITRVGVAIKGLASLLTSLAPFAIFMGLTDLYRIMTKASRAAEELKENLNSILVEDSVALEGKVENFTNLATRLGELNAGTLERKEIIGKLNSEYGEFLNFTVTELTTTKKLVEAYDEVVKKMKEKSALQSFEKGVATIEESYGTVLKEAKEDFYELFEGSSIKAAQYSDKEGIIPTKKEIDDIYNLLQAKISSLNIDAMDSLSEQADIISQIISDYYGKEYFLSRDWGQSIELIDILIDKKKKEEELQESINAQYKDVLKSREANVELEKLQAEYAVKRKQQAEDSAKSEFERKKILQQLADEEQIATINLKVKFGEMSQHEADEQIKAIKEWETELTKAINDELTENITVGKEFSKITKEMTELGDTMNKQFVGNVDLLNRNIIPAIKLAEKGWKDVGDGIATVFSSSYGVKNKEGKEVEILVTPILPDGTVLSQEELENYIDTELSGAEDILKADTKGLVISVGVSPEAGEQLHAMQEQYYNLKQEALSAEETLSKVLISRDTQKTKGTSEYLKEIKSSWETQNTIVADLISLKSAGVKINEKELTQALKLENLYREAENTLGLEIEAKESLSEQSRQEINNLIESEKHHITIEQAYRGTAEIVKDLQNQEKKYVAIIEELEERKKNGLVIDEEKLRITIEDYLWTKKKLDLIDKTAKTPISSERAGEINAKLDESHRISGVDLGKDEVTLLSEANSEKDKAIAREKQLLAMRKQGNTVTKKELELAKTEIEQWTLRWKLLGGTETEKKTTGGRTNSLYDERIKVIDDMVKKYEELRKLFGEDEAIAGAFEAYKDAFADAYKDISWVDKNVKTMTPEQFVEKVLNFPDKNKIVKFLDTLSKEPMKAFEKIKVELAKGEYVYEMRIDAKTDTDDALKQQIEGMFSDYELSLDLEKLDFPPDLAKQLFSLDTMDLESLRKNIEKLRPQFVGKNMEKEYEEYLKKVSEMEDKAQLERLKKYSKYLVKGMNERVKLKYEEAKQLAVIESLNYTPEQEKIIKDSVREETQKKMDKLDWEDFKNSEVYIRIFQDLERVSTKTLKTLRDKLVQMKGQLKNLDPTEVKAIVDALAKYDAEISKRNPYKTATLGIGQYFKALSDTKKLEKKLLEGQQTEESLNKRFTDRSEELGEEEAKLKAMEKSGKVGEVDLKQQRDKVSLLQKQVADLQEQLKLQKKLNGETGQSLDDAKNFKASFTGSWAEIGSDISNAASALPQMAADIENVFGAMDAGTKDTIESISEIGNGVGSAIQGIASGNYIQAAAGVLQAISGIAAIGDKKKERQIQREKEKVEELQRAYERLEEVISYSYNIDEINSNYDAAKKNLEDQIKSTQEMRRLEEDKKKTDQSKIKEYTRQIEDYQKQLQELEDERINQLGGIAGGDAIKSASENFVNAWIDAFKETGDGLSGLEEQFDEVFMNLVKKQVLGRGVDKMLEPLYANLEGMLKDGAMDAQEYEDFNKQWNSLSPQIDEFLTKMINDLGIADDITKKTGELSGLQSGIQGITEDQADILAAYWSSVRFIVSNIEQKFTDYARQMLGTDLNANPILNELKEHTRILDSIDSKLESIIGHSGGAHVKTYLMS